MAVNPPAFILKAIWLTHFALSSWALMSGFLTVSTYWYTHIGVLAFGAWSILSNESTDAVIMFLATLAFSVVNDIILIALYEPRGHDNFEASYMNISTSQRNEYRFALGMCITNLLLKPVSLFFLYRIYQSRSSGTDFNAGISGIPGLGSAFGGRRPGYDNVESSPGHTNPYVRQSEPPGYQAPAYQEPPPLNPAVSTKS
uniref:Type-1 angiotensin II receptor-associated protein n=1 Tax=Arion vulgaris TaxID=1028688 RepID=A0A0B7ATT5_9EUPU